MVEGSPDQKKVAIQKWWQSKKGRDQKMDAIERRTQLKEGHGKK